MALRRSQCATAGVFHTQWHRSAEVDACFLVSFFRARLAALKKYKDLKNLPLTKGDFLKQSSKTTVEAQNVDPLLEIHPSDDDLMSTASETDVSSSSPKKS
ncbi:hypothetical protein AVEN_50952-1 [Araneus ventricosus]|uniref:Uncharacterized protein n=1 Tax=Araneus ventricosus TaxID=182803 RepID=A0A4Y2RBJ7_ARAVE|nr:hypothetical protein AVEN_50952-1 [Araneus ventricosus]